MVVLTVVKYTIYKTVGLKTSFPYTLSPGLLDFTYE